jgi:hypothetical protein
MFDLDGSLATQAACAATTTRTVRERTLCTYKAWMAGGAGRAPPNCQLLYDLGNI